MGYTLLTPVGGGVVIGANEQFTIDGQLFQFSKTTAAVAAGAIRIDIKNTDSAETIAQKVETAINTAGLPITTHLLGNRIALQDAGLVTLGSGSSLTLEGNCPGTLTDPSAIPIVINAGMTDAEVAIAIADVLDATFSFVDDPTIYTSVKLENNVLRIINHSVDDPGPLPLTNSLLSDLYGDPTSPGAGLNNAFEGPRIDDIIIGFAERGEMVTGPLPVDNSYFNLPTDPNPPGTEVLQGAYQLEIRRGTEYGQQNPPNPFAPDPPDILLINAFNTNDRLTNALTIVAPPPTQISDGMNFRVSDGINQVTFELDRNGVVSPGATPRPL